MARLLSSPPTPLPEHSKCKEKGLAGLEPPGPMSPVSTAQAGGWAGANGHSQGGGWHHQGQAQDKVTDQPQQLNEGQRKREGGPGASGHTLPAQSACKKLWF